MTARTRLPCSSQTAGRADGPPAMRACRSLSGLCDHASRWPRHRRSDQTNPVSSPYRRFAGRSLDRVQALSDGVFAIATTLLVLDLRVPIGAAHTDRALWSALADLGPGFAAFVLSFTMLGTFWLAQHTLLGMCQRGDRTLSWLQLGFLIPVTLLPFSASLLAEFVTVRSAVGSTSRCLASV